MNNETWLPIVGYEGLYEVSDLGRVRSLPRATTKGRILKQHVSARNGYCHVSLSKNNDKKTRRVHILVLQTFSPVEKRYGYDKNYTIDHIDGDKTNNRLDNLEWCTQSENVKRAYALGIVGKPEKKVIDLDTGEVFDSVTKASLSVGGVKAGPVTRVCRGIRSQYRNHRFAYYDDHKNGTIPKYKGKVRRKSSESLWVR